MASVEPPANNNIGKRSHYVTGECSAVSEFYYTHLPSGQNGRCIADDILKCVFLNENVWISIKIHWIFVPKDLVDNNPALIRILAWHRVVDKPLSEPMLTRFNHAYVRHKGEMSLW